MRQAALLLIVAVAPACTNKNAGSILSDTGCHEESRQEMAMTRDMCVGAVAPPSSASAPPPAATPPPPAPAPTGSASAGAAEAPPPEPPPAPPPEPAAPVDAAALDPTKCEIDCNRACGGVPDSVCKRLDDRLIECAVVRLGDPCK